MSFNNDPQGSPPDPLTLSDVDNPPVSLSTLDSFLPILKHLLHLDQNLYYIRGSITTADWARLHDYARMVSKFIVTDVPKDSEARISPATFFRLARFQQHDIPFFPSLSDIVIVDADASIACLELLLTPSLKSLKASCIPDAQQLPFLSFLTAIEQEAPLFETLILGPGQFLPDCFQTIHQLTNLCHLELKYEDSEVPFGFFEDIGSLPKLETFILDARYVSNFVTKNQSNSMEEHMVPPAFEDDNPLLPDNLPDSNSMDGKDGAGDVHLSQICHTPILTSGSFKQLTKLDIIGWLPLLEDLITRIVSTRLEDISVTLIRLSYDELQVSLAEKVAEEERKRDAEKQRRDAETQSIFGEPWSSSVFSREAEACTKKSKKKKGKTEWWSKEEEEDSEQEAQALREAQEAQEAQEAREAQETSLSFDAHTASFTKLFRTLYCRGMASLKAVSVCQLGGSFQPLLKPAALPEEMFRELLFFPTIESLEVKGWMLDSVESVLRAAQSIPNLKSLLLPLDDTNSGISLATLRCVAETCPKLESFQCRIEPLSLIPKYDVPTTDGLSHGLRLLSVGNSSPLSNTKQLYLVARHLYLLFPTLETINTSKEHNMKQWVVVDNYMKMFQTARMDDMNRRSAPVTQ